MGPEDFAFSVELANTMNWNMTPDDFKFNLDIEPTGSFILQDNNQPYGLITSVSYGNVGWFGNLIVTSNARRKGAGHTLVRHTLRYLHEKGVKTVGIYAYPQLESFYRSLGFKPDEEFVVMHNPQVNCTHPFSATPATLQDLPLLNQLDYACFGWNRQKLLGAIMGNPKNPVLCLKEAGCVVGFVAAKVYGQNAELGPLVCNLPDIARQLVLAVLNRLDGLAVSVYLPLNQKSLCEILIGLGVVEDFRLIRMFWGKPKPNSCMYIAESLERG
jgi:hypothetical protein